ncbi:unnamed protein product [Urochloa humidicola]
MKPFGSAAKLSANKNARVEELNLQSDQMKEFVHAEGYAIPRKRSAKIHDFCLGVHFGGLLFSVGLPGYIFSRSTKVLSWALHLGSRLDCQSELLEER